MPLSEQIVYKGNHNFIKVFQLIYKNEIIEFD